MTPEAWWAFGFACGAGSHWLGTYLFRLYWRRFALRELERWAEERMRQERRSRQ